MTKVTQTFFILLLSVSLLLTSHTVFSQGNDFGDVAPNPWGISVSSALKGDVDLKTLRSLQNLAQKNYGNLITEFENQNRYTAAEITTKQRDLVLNYLNARVKKAEEARDDYYRNVFFVIHAVLMDGADSVDENVPSEPNPVVDEILPIIQDQTKKNATDLLHGHIASRIPDSGAVVIFNISSQMYNVDAGLPSSSVSSVTAQDDVENNENGGDGAITIQKPLQFANGGLYDATVRVASYIPAEGVRADMSGASTVVFRGSNPSANLSLPIGTYVFCYDWDLGTDADKDGYVDYAHKNTGSVTLTAQSTDNMNSALAVTLDPKNMDNPNGKCGETAPPPPSGNAGGLTPQELANRGTHTYQTFCKWDDGEEENFSEVLTFEFVEDGVNYTDEADGYFRFYQKTSVNIYENINEDGRLTITFTDAGYKDYFDRDGYPIDDIHAIWIACTGTRR